MELGQGVEEYGSFGRRRNKKEQTDLNSGEEVEGSDQRGLLSYNFDTKYL